MSSLEPLPIETTNARAPLEATSFGVLALQPGNRASAASNNMFSSPCYATTTSTKDRFDTSATGSLNSLLSVSASVTTIRPQRIVSNEPIISSQSRAFATATSNPVTLSTQYGMGSPALSSTQSSGFSADTVGAMILRSYFVSDVSGELLLIAVGVA